MHQFRGDKRARTSLSEKSRPYVGRSSLSLQEQMLHFHDTFRNLAFQRCLEAYVKWMTVIVKYQLSLSCCVLQVFIFGSVMEWSHTYNRYLYVALWIVNGLLQSSGWPTVVAVMGNWFGKSRYSTGHYWIDEICGSGVVPVNWNFVVISTCFAIFKNVVHSLKPGETPRYSASHQASNYVQNS